MTLRLTSALFSADSNACGLKSLNTTPVPVRRARSYCSTESARPPVRRTMGTVP